MRRRTASLKPLPLFGDLGVSVMGALGWGGGGLAGERRGLRPQSEQVTNLSALIALWSLVEDQRGGAEEAWPVSRTLRVSLRSWSLQPSFGPTLEIP